MRCDLKIDQEHLHITRDFRGKFVDFFDVIHNQFVPHLSKLKMSKSCTLTSDLSKGCQVESRQTYKCSCSQIFGA
jgi:hypothetical protein